jgi:hypothetical protein
MYVSTLTVFASLNQGMMFAKDSSRPSILNDWPECLEESLQLEGITCPLRATPPVLSM